MSKKQVESSYRQLYDGMIQKDFEILSEILNDNFVLEHMSGMRQSKESFIRAIKDGTLNYFSSKHQNIETNIDEDTAELIGQSIVDASVFGGNRHTWRLQLKIKLIKKDNAWKMIEAIASTY